MKWVRKDIDITIFNIWFKGYVSYVDTAPGLT